MRYLGLNALIVVIALGAADAQARLLSAALPAPDKSEQTAVHKPTGCQARLVLSGGAFVKASIIDPDCLPKGVSARDIPGTLFDFLVTPK